MPAYTPYYKLPRRSKKFGDMLLEGNGVMEDLRIAAERVVSLIPSEYPSSVRMKKQFVMAEVTIILPARVRMTLGIHPVFDRDGLEYSIPFPGCIKKKEDAPDTVHITVGNLRSTMRYVPRLKSLLDFLASAMTEGNAFEGMSLEYQCTDHTYTLAKPRISHKIAVRGLSKHTLDKVLDLVDDWDLETNGGRIYVW